MENKRKSLREIVSANVAALAAKHEASEQALSKRGHTAQKNVNNAKNGGNLTLNTIEGLARTFGIPPWVLLLPEMDVERAKLDHAEFIRAFDDAEPKIQRAVEVLLGLRGGGEDEQNNTKGG